MKVANATAALSLLALSVGCTYITNYPAGPDAGNPDAGSMGPSDAGAVPADATVGPDAAGPACNAMTCAGCCMNDACQAGTAQAACGKGAAACQLCGALDACQADQTCGFDRSRTWDITIVSSSIAGNTPAGACWDLPCGAPDPFLTLNGSQVTSTKPDTYAPYWGYTTSATAGQIMAGGASLGMMDEDVSFNDTVASPRALKFSEAELRSGAAVWIGWGSVTRTDFTFKSR